MVNGEGLITEVLANKIQGALFSMGDDKAPSPNVFTVKFFKMAWEIVGPVVVEVVRSFFSSSHLLGQMNAAIISLVPKATFGPRRSIRDNVLLAQELMFQYHLHKGPPRCAMKVDLAKAYDSMEWDFLLIVLHLMTFPPQFCSWICECVTTPRYSIKINGQLNGFFPEGWGLRKRDPLSPYLFVLVIQILHGIVSHQTRDESLRENILTVAGFQRGVLPMQYLGMPLLSTKLSYGDCQPIIDKAFVFILSKRVVHEIEQLIRNFLWSDDSADPHRAKVAWQEICCPKVQGSLGLKPLYAWNQALVTKLIWRLLSGNGESL
ncbi:uncharacterized protein LOC127788096 [Diospyros lotus]|uniref:uncharacterized protein LOC127788096 n=1 Tax=Diospyros lotus TaxID=55363 RepID=UPI002257723C|nr:uncharacterized protein LOC127788096 [Diospyros lotus]